MSERSIGRKFSNHSMCKILKRYGLFQCIAQNTNQPPPPRYLWNQFESTRDQKQKTSDSVEGSHRAFQIEMGCTHQTIHKFIEFIRRDQSLAENKLTRIRSRDKASKTAKHKKAQLRLSEI